MREVLDSASKCYLLRFQLGEVLLHIELCLAEELWLKPLISSVQPGTYILTVRMQTQWKKESLSSHVGCSAHSLTIHVWTGYGHD